MKTNELYEIINGFAPFSSQCDWDNSGLLIGSPETEIIKIGFSLDATRETIEDAKQNGCNVIVTHHPVIFNPISSIDEKNPVYLAVKYGIAVISSHTPFDKADPGVNTVLAGLLGLSDAKTMSTDEDGICRIGTLSKPMTEKEFAGFTAKVLGGGVRYSPCGNTVSIVAVCGGAGGELYKQAKDAGADAFVTGEAKHHEFLGAKNNGITLYAAGHFETEAPAVRKLKELCESKADAECVMLSETKTTEFTGAI